MCIVRGRQIVLDRIGGKPAAALIVDGRLDDLLVEPPAHLPRPGAIYRARLERPMKGQGGGFVRLTETGQTGFLRAAKGMRPGAPVLVQVTGFAEAGKAAPVTTRLLFKSRHVIATPDAPGLNMSRRITDAAARTRLQALAAAIDRPETLGLILRSTAATGAEAALSRDIAETVALACRILAEVDAGDCALLLPGPDPEALARRDWVVTGAETFLDTPGALAETAGSEALAALLAAEVPLPGGGRVFVEPTRALVAVDVDTGGDASPAAGLKANIAAARALPRALRLRGLGGQIAVDFAPMPKKDRAALDQALRAAFRDDGIETALVGWTPLGHFELQRKRERLPLKDCLS